MLEQVVDVTGAHKHAEGALLRQIGIEGDLSAEQKTALLRVARACPVDKTLTGEITIDTSFAETPAGTPL